jgi:intracellular sulfur oxidation DsrE/DsrF family protein
MNLILALSLAAPLLGATGTAPPPSGKIVLVALSGPEDVMKLMAPYHHAAVMKKTGRLQEVAIVVYGRAVAALSTKAKGIPPPVREAIKAAHAAGVSIYVCETALANAGIDEIVPEAQRVPQGAAKIAELVSEGFVPMQY